MIIRFTDIEGNIFLVPTSNITCCVLYVCGDSDANCNEYYHYNIVINKVEVEVRREEFIRVFHWMADKDTQRDKQIEIEIPEQKLKNESMEKTR